MIIDELITILGFDIKDKEKLNQYQQNIGNAVDKLQTMAVVGTAALGAMLTGITAVNSETAKMANLADAVGMNADTANAFSSIAKSIGLDTEHVVDLFEEMNNKIGESKAKYADWLKDGKGKGKELKLVGGLEDALKGLDLSSVDKSFKGLKLEEKVKKIFAMDSNAQYDLFTQAAAVAKDAQQAASSLDILMGSQANKIASALRNHLKEVGLTYDEWKIKKKELNYLDKKGLHGAKVYAKQVADTSELFGSMTKQLSGLAGEYLAPILKSMNDWFRLNKKIVEVNLKKYVDTFFQALQSLGQVLKATWWLVDNVAKSLGGWDVVLTILGLILAIFNPWKAILLGVMLVADDLFSYFSGGKSVIGDFMAYFKSEFPLLSKIIGSANIELESFGEGLMYAVMAFLFLKKGFKIMNMGLGLLGKKGKKTNSVIGETVDALDELSRSTKKPLSARLGMQTPKKRTILDKLRGIIRAAIRYLARNKLLITGVLTPAKALMGSMRGLLSALSRFALAHPIVLGAVMTGTAAYGAYQLYKKTLEKDIMGIAEKNIAVGKREEEANVPLAQRTVSPAQVQQEEEKIAKRRENLDNGINKLFTLADMVKKSVSDNPNVVEKINNVKESFVNNNAVEKTKEIVNNVGNAMASSPMGMSMQPLTAPVPAMHSVNNTSTNNMSHTHNNNYNINVSSKGGTPSETANIIKTQILNSKTIEKANINKVKPIYGA